MPKYLKAMEQVGTAGHDDHDNHQNDRCLDIQCPHEKTFGVPGGFQKSIIARLLFYAILR